MSAHVVAGLSAPAAGRRGSRAVVAVGFAGCAACLLTAAGCADPAAVQPGDIRTYTAARSAESSPARPASPATAAAAPRTAGSPGSRPGGLRLRYEAPEGWTDRGGSGMRLATLVIGGAEQPHEVTVIPASGTLRANVDRWLGQLEPDAAAEALGPRAEAALEAAEKVAIGDVEASVVLLLDDAAAAGPDSEGEAILGAMIPLDDSASLFVKFKGPATVARRERDNFIRFVSSIRWN